MSRKVYLILLAVLTLAVTACGGGSGTNSVADIAEGILKNAREFGPAWDDKSDNEIRTWAECTVVALLNAGFSEDELYDHFIGGAWREDIGDARVNDPDSSQCFNEFYYGPPLELPDGDLFELAVTAYASVFVDMTPTESETVARCTLTRIRDAGFSDEDIWRYAVDDYGSGAPSRVFDADVDYWNCSDLLYTDE